MSRDPELALLQAWPEYRVEREPGLAAGSAAPSASMGAAAAT